MGALLSIFFSTVTADHPASTVFGDNPAILPVRIRKEHEGDIIEHVSLKELLKTRVPSLFTPFQPLWYLFNGHLQTLYCVFGDFTQRDKIVYSRKYLRLADGGTLGLDYAPLDQDSVPDDAPIVVVQHGLTGGSYEAYVRAIFARACAPISKGGLGYRGIVINYRGCAGVPITSQKLYSAGATDDTRSALAFIQSQYPKARLLGMGFSLGSNVITRYLGEEMDKARLNSACVMACPWNLLDNNNGLVNSFTGTHIYSKGMGGNLQKLLRRHSASIMSDPTNIVAVAAKHALSLKNPTLGEFDEAFIRIAGGGPPHFPFPSSTAYYVWASSDQVLPQIRRPFLAINADDDPVVRHVPMDQHGNGFVVIRLTRGGGHLGWFTAGDGFVDRWTTKPVLEWLKLMAEDVVMDDTKEKAPKFYVDEEGWLREEGRPHLGCKELEGKGHIFAGMTKDGGVLQGL